MNETKYIPPVIQRSSRSGRSGHHAVKPDGGVVQLSPRVPKTFLTYFFSSRSAIPGNPDER